jgi:hypothetical protein
MNTVEERLARYRYELDAVNEHAAIEDVRPAGTPQGDSRRALMLIAAAVLVIAGLVAVARRNADDSPASGGDALFAWTTSRVVFTANTFTIDVGGQQFSPTGVNVDVHTDPGDATYSTLELSWEQYGVPMNVNVYFAADASDWWATEIRTYNGKSGTDADWVTVTGEQFRTPLGGTYTGDVDVTATENDQGITSHLQIRGMTLTLLPASTVPTASTTPQPYDSIPVGSTTTTLVGEPTKNGPTLAPEQWYSVPEGDLASVAALFGVSPESIAFYNGWTDGVSHVLAAGSTVRIPPDAGFVFNAVIPYGSVLINPPGITMGVGATNDLTGLCLLTPTEISGCDTLEQPTAPVVVSSSLMDDPSHALIYGIADADLSISVVDASGNTIGAATMTPAYQGRRGFVAAVTTANGLSILATDSNQQTTSYPAPV